MGLCPKLCEFWHKISCRRFEKETETRSDIFEDRQKTYLILKTGLSVIKKMLLNIIISGALRNILNRKKIEKSFISIHK